MITFRIIIHFSNNDTRTKGRYTYQREIHLPKGDTLNQREIHLPKGDPLFET